MASFKKFAIRINPLFCIKHWHFQNVPLACLIEISYKEMFKSSLILAIAAFYVTAFLLISFDHEKDEYILFFEATMCILNFCYVVNFKSKDLARPYYTQIDNIEW